MLPHLIRSLGNVVAPPNLALEQLCTSISAQQGCAADALQRALRSRFPPRLMPSVAMTSNVKSAQQIFLRFSWFFCPRCIGKGGASKTRRLILLLSVDW